MMINDQFADFATYYPELLREALPNITGPAQTQAFFWDVRLPPEAACVLLYDLLAEMQTEPHSVRLRSLIGLEHAIRHLRNAHQDRCLQPA